MFFNQIMKIASFNLIDIDSYINRMLNLHTTNPQNQNFKQLGFSSTHFLNNMGSMIFGFIFYLFGIIIVLLLDPIAGKSKFIETIVNYLKGMLFHNYIISMMIESYSNISLCCYISLWPWNLKFISYGEIIQSVFCLFFFVMLFAFPVWIII